MRKNKAITDALLEAYPEGKCALKYDNAFELLVASRLSAQCTDIRVNMVTEKMFATLKTPMDFASVDVSVIENYIRSCGLYRVKAKDISEMSKILVEKFDSEVPSAYDDLISLPGIGSKIANLILGEVFNVPGVIIADTHCIRLANRLGYCKSENQHIVERELRKCIPQDKSLLFCHAMVNHGRNICKARNPLCNDCFLRSKCKSSVIK